MLAVITLYLYGMLLFQNHLMHIWFLSPWSSCSKFIPILQMRKWRQKEKKKDNVLAQNHVCDCLDA